MPERKALHLAAGSTALGLVLAATAAGLAGPWDGGQRKAERLRAAALAPVSGAHHEPDAPAAPPAPTPTPAPAPSAPEVLAALKDPSGTAAPGPARTLDPLLRDPGLGPLRTAAVVDTATGRQLYGNGATTPLTPASTVKLVTTAAALSALGPDHRLTTTVVADPADPRRLTLVGGGDPTLTEARLKDLAKDTARALPVQQRKPDKGDQDTPRKVTLTYDTSLYTGPVRHPIGVNDNLAPVTALMINAARPGGTPSGGSTASGPAPRAADPADDTARVFAALLKAQGVPVTGTPAQARTPKGAEELARTRSAPVSALVERTLTHSDNDLAEALARHTALATGHPASFDGAGKALRDQLVKLDVPLDGARLHDGSGLDRRNRVSARLLTTVLTRAADPHLPELRPVLTGLPVGGFTGTLKTRYGSDSPGAGLVRAKTGTLTGVNALSGLAVTPDGRVLAFAFLAADTPSPWSAQPALDALATALTDR